jgi:hypothetical protein
VKETEIDPTCFSYVNSMLISKSTLTSETVYHVFFKEEADLATNQEHYSIGM